MHTKCFKVLILYHIIRIYTNLHKLTSKITLKNYISQYFPFWEYFPGRQLPVFTSGKFPPIPDQPCSQMNISWPPLIRKHSYLDHGYLGGSYLIP